MSREDANTLLATGEVAALFGVDPKTVTRWASGGQLAALRTPGGHRRFRLDEVDTKVALYRSGGPAPPAEGGRLNRLPRRRHPATGKRRVLCKTPEAP